MNRKTLLTIFSLIVTTAISFVVFWPDNKLHLIACNVGQGDAILITHKFTQILVDGGPNDRVLGCLARNMPFWDRHLEMVVNTHPEADHIKGLVPVLERYQVKQVITNSLYNNTDLFAQFHDLIQKNKSSVYSPHQGEKIRLDGLEFEILWPDSTQGDLALWRKPLPNKEAILGESTPKIKFNETSIVLLLHYGNFKALLSGDMTDKLEAQVVDFCQNGDCGQPIDVLKVAHHGSKTSTTQEFLDQFRPKTALISVGQNNQWGHPTQEVLDRLTSIGVKILRTDLLGELQITTDGERIFP